MVNRNISVSVLTISKCKKSKNFIYVLEFVKKFMYALKKLKEPNSYTQSSNRKKIVNLENHE